MVIKKTHQPTPPKKNPVRNSTDEYKEPLVACTIRLPPTAANHKIEEGDANAITKPSLIRCRLAGDDIGTAATSWA